MLDDSDVSSLVSTNHSTNHSINHNNSNDHYVGIAPTQLLSSDATWELTQRVNGFARDMERAADLHFFRSRFPTQHEHLLSRVFAEDPKVSEHTRAVLNTPLSVHYDDHSGSICRHSAIHEEHLLHMPVGFGFQTLLEDILYLRGIRCSALQNVSLPVLLSVVPGPFKWGCTFDVSGHDERPRPVHVMVDRMLLFALSEYRHVVLHYISKYLAHYYAAEACRESCANALLTDAPLQQHADDYSNYLPNLSAFVDSAIADAVKHHHNLSHHHRPHNNSLVFQK